MTSKRQLLTGLALTAAFALAAPAFAFNGKPVRIIVPAPAGGTADIVARALADQLSAQLGQPVIVDNKPGAGGVIAVQALLAAPPDGQTLMMSASNVLTEVPHVLKGNFDPMKDLKPAAVVARASMVLVVAPTVPAKDMKELVAWVKARPGTQSFASYSAGTSSQYAGMILNQKAGLDLQHVPFNGSPPGADAGDRGPDPDDVRRHGHVAAADRRRQGEGDRRCRRRPDPRTCRSCPRWPSRAIPTSSSATGSA